jgi:hypothetical protein
MLLSHGSREAGTRVGAAVRSLKTIHEIKDLMRVWQRAE